MKRDKPLIIDLSNKYITTTYRPVEDHALHNVSKLERFPGGVTFSYHEKQVYLADRYLIQRLRAYHDVALEISKFTGYSVDMVERLQRGLDLKLEVLFLQEKPIEPDLNKFDYQVFKVLKETYEGLRFSLPKRLRRQHYATI